MEIVVPHRPTGPAGVGHHHNEIYHDDSDVEILDEDDIIEEEIIEDDEEILIELDHDEVLEEYLIDEVDYDDVFDEVEIVLEEELYEEEVIDDDDDDDDDEEEVLLDDNEDIVVEEIIEEVGMLSSSRLPSSREIQNDQDYETKQIVSLKENDKISFVTFHKRERQKPSSSPPLQQQQQKLQKPQESKKDVERWINRNDKEPDDLKTACEVLLDVLYENNNSGDENDDEIDTDTMMRRTPLRELYRYLKHQYWYKVHSGQLSPDALSKVVATSITSTTQQQQRQNDTLQVQTSEVRSQFTPVKSPRHLDQFFAKRLKQDSIPEVVDKPKSLGVSDADIEKSVDPTELRAQIKEPVSIDATKQTVEDNPSKAALQGPVGEDIAVYQFLIPAIVAVIAGYVYFISST